MSATVYQRKNSIDASWAGDRVVLYDRDSRSALTLNPTGSQLWNELESPRGVTDLVAYLLDNFEGITQEQAKADVEFFLNELMEKALISPAKA